MDPRPIPGKLYLRHILNAVFIWLLFYVHIFYLQPSGYFGWWQIIVLLNVTQRLREDVVTVLESLLKLHNGVAVLVLSLTELETDATALSVDWIVRELILQSDILGFCFQLWSLTVMPFRKERNARILFHLWKELWLYVIVVVEQMLRQMSLGFFSQRLLHFFTLVFMVITNVAVKVISIFYCIVHALISHKVDIARVCWYLNDVSGGLLLHTHFLNLNLEFGFIYSIFDLYALSEFSGVNRSLDSHEPLKLFWVIRHWQFHNQVILQLQVLKM